MRILVPLQVEADSATETRQSGSKGALGFVLALCEGSPAEARAPCAGVQAQGRRAGMGTGRKS